MTDDADDIGAVLGRLGVIAERVAEDEKQLPCHGIKPDRAAGDACSRVDGFRVCRLALNSDACPRARLSETHALWAKNLEAAQAPERSARPLLASARVDGAIRLQRREPLKVIWSYLHDPGVQFPSGIVKGHERLLILAGPRRLGKSTAACLALAERGGAYMLAHDFRPGFDVDRALRARVLVIDQWGRETHGDSDWSLQLLEHVVKTRYEHRRHTIGCGNFHGRRGEFEQFYGPIIASLLAEGGAWFDFGGTP